MQGNIEDCKKFADLIYENWQNSMWNSIIGVQPIGMLCDLFSKNQSDVSDKKLAPYMGRSEQEEI